ncbi:choice-of-anchor Q domain-containing protein, partial [Bacteroidota bacterium]
MQEVYTQVAEISAVHLCLKNPTPGSGISYSIKNSDWSLQPSSPCIDAGDNTGITGMLPAFDIIGKIRIYNTDIDMGAYEDKSLLAVCGRITKNEVWDANKIQINCDVTIENGVTVTVLPGVKVEFQGSYFLRVKGRLLAFGT